jgi:cytoskeletal protein CcmA (bactofilin family)
MPFGIGSHRKSRVPVDIEGQDVVGFIEPGVEFEGTMKVSSGMIRLNGHFKGNLHSAGIVVVVDQGEAEGEIHSKIISVAGKLKGAVHATELVEIKARGVILGDIYTPALTVEPGGYFDGQCHMPAPIAGSAPARPAKGSEPERSVSGSR